MSTLLNTGAPRKESWPSWQVSKVSTIEYKHVMCLVEDASAEPVTVSALPTEFFNHELAAVDVSDDQSIVDFVSRWGIPHCPFLRSWDDFLNVRNGKGRIEKIKDVWKHAQSPASVFGGVLETILPVEKNYDIIRGGLTREVYELYFSDEWWGTQEETTFWKDEAAAVADSKFVQRSRRRQKGEGGIIALSEVRRAIANLQEITRIMSYLDGMESAEDAIARIREDAAERDAAVSSPYVASILKGVDAFEKVQGWSVEAGEYLAGCLWPLTRSVVSVPNPQTGRAATPGVCGESDERFGLMEAVCIQFYYLLGDGNPWQTCGYDGCGRWFKYQRQNSEGRYLMNDKKGGTGFCCKSHSVMENRRLNAAAFNVAGELQDRGCDCDGAAEAMRGHFTQAQIDRALDKVFSAQD